MSLLQKIDPRPYKRSPIVYMGSKYRLLPDLRQVFRQSKGTDKFIDVFTGSMTVAFDSKFENLAVNDIQKELIDFYRWCRESVDLNTIDREVNGLYREYRPYEEKGFYRLRDRYNSDKSDMVAFFLVSTFCFDSFPRFSKAGNFNTPFGGDRVTTMDNKLRILREFILKLRSCNVDFYSMDYKELIDTIGDSRKNLWYFDPPYLGTISNYTNNWKEESQAEFLKVLDSFIEKRIPFVFSYCEGFNGKENVSFKEWMDKVKSSVNIRYPRISYGNSASAKKIRNAKTNEVIIYNFGE